MSRYSLICPECHAEVSLSARRLTVRVDDGTPTTGEVIFTCLSCHATVTVPLDPPDVALLVTGGVSHLSIPTPTVAHPTAAPPGPALTHDDLLDLHRELDSDSWFDRLVRPDC